MVGIIEFREYRCGRPLKTRNSVLEGLRDIKLDNIHAVGYVSYRPIVFSRCVMLREKSTAENDKRS